MAAWLQDQKGLKLLLLGDMAMLSGPTNSLVPFLRGVFQPSFEGKETPP